MDKKSNRYVNLISILCLLIVVANILGLSYAFFTNKVTADDVVFTFGDVDINATVYNADNSTTNAFVFNSENVMAWETIDKKVKISATESTEHCALRMFLKFQLYVDTNSDNTPDKWLDVSNKNYLQFEIADGDSNWVLGTSTQSGMSVPTYYYTKVLYKNYADILTDFQIIVTDNFGSETDELTNNQGSFQYKITLVVESLQWANDGTTAWAGAPVGWNPTNN